MTEKLGDLKSSNINQSRKFIIDPHFDYLAKNWKHNKSIGYAADLLSTGLIVNPKNSDVISSAQFILESKESNSSQKSLAFLILGNELETIPSEDKNLKWFLNYNNIIYKRISYFKAQIIQFQYNAFNYAEISRLYLIIGEKDKAKEFMKKALYIGSNNRYILRSAVRLFVHLDELELPHSYLRKYKNIKNDPWLLSAEIALSTLRNRTSRLIKSGFTLIDSNNHSEFSTTELSSALGTVELFNGSIKKSKKLFLKSLNCPNDNSLAQVEWATNKGGLFNLNPNEFNHVENKFEAMSIDSFHNHDWEETIKNTENWFIDSPFSKTPTMLGSHVALTYLDSPNKSIDFCKAGLVSHPYDPQLINNLSYSYGLLGNVKDAEDNLNKIDINYIEDYRVKNCLFATKGLIEFRKGNIEKGRKLYIKVIEDTAKKGYKNLNRLATLNFAHEELLSKETSNETILNLIDKLKISKEDIGLNLLKEKVIKLTTK